MIRILTMLERRRADACSRKRGIRRASEHPSRSSREGYLVAYSPAAMTFSIKSDVV